MSATLKLQRYPPDLNEGYIREVFKTNLPFLTIERMRSLHDGLILVTVSVTNERFLDDLYQIFPLANNQIGLEQTWVHYPDTPSIVLLHDPPNGVNCDKLEAYLDGLEIGIENIFSSQDGGDTITVELSDPTDLPYLVTKKHTMRRQPIIFHEASTPDLPNISVKGLEQANIEQSFPTSIPIVNQQAPTPFFYQNRSSEEYSPPPPSGLSNLKVTPPQNGTHSSQNDTPRVEDTFVPLALKILVIDSQLSDSFIEQTLRQRFLRHPYYLTVDFIWVKNGTAYVTFLEGIDKAVADPLPNIIGCPVESETIPFEEVMELKNPPKVLQISNLPDKMEESKVKRTLERLFKSVGHVVKKSTVKGNDAFVTFNDAESVRKLFNNPPDSGTLAGHPIVYSIAKEDTDMVTEEKREEEHHLLIVDNLPDDWEEEELDEDFTTFMNNTTLFKIASCKVKNGKGYVHYENPEDAKKVAQRPPSLSFFGQSISFKSEPVTKHKLVHSDSVPADMPSQGNKKEISPGGIKPKTSPAASPIPPPIKPRGSSDIIIKGLSPDITEHYLTLYLQSLPIGMKCERIHMKEETAIIKLNNKIDVKTLQQNIRAAPLPNNDNITVEPFRLPTTTRLSTDHSESIFKKLSDSFNVKEVPSGVREWQLFAHLTSLIQNEAKLTDVQMSGNTAVLKMDRKIDIKALQQKAVNCPLPEGPLLIECPFSPTSSPNNTGPHSGDIMTETTPLKSLLHFFTKTILVREIPHGVKEYVVTMYLQNLSGGVPCTDIQMRNDTAIVTFEREIDVKNLRHRCLEVVFPVDKVVLNIEAHKPSNSVLVSPEGPLPGHVLEVYCDRYEGEVKIDKKEGYDYIVTFKERNIQQRFLQDQPHVAGVHKFTASDYDPLLNKPPSPTSHPPPLPPRKEYYTWPNCKVTIPSEAHKYYLHFQKSINEELLSLEGELHIGLKALEIKPLARASEMEDWESLVRRKIESYQQKFATATIDLPTQVASTVLDHLANIQSSYPDLEYKPHGQRLTLAGHMDTVQKLTDEIQTMLSEEIEITYTIEKPPRFIQYIRKFARDDIRAIQPKVSHEYNEDKPGIIVLRGVKRSLEMVRNISETKIKHAHTEIIPLTNSAYKLLNCLPQGKIKLKETLQDIEHLVFYMCEKTDQVVDYQYQLCILSPDSVSCHSAKRRITSLIEEKQMPLSPKEREICNGQEWKVLIDQITARNFIYVSLNNGIILLTGEVACLREISEQITTFLRAQNVVTDKFSVAGPSWQLINDLKKLKDVQKYAKSRNVKINVPDTRISNEEMCIGLSGEPRALEDVKMQLQMLINEVNYREFSIRSQPGLDKVMEKGMIRMKCLEIEHKYKLVIKYSLEEVIVQPPPITGTIAAPLRVLSANCPNGNKVQVYTGDHTKKRCGALAMFVSEAPGDKEHPMMASLVVAGGTDVEGSLRVLTLKPRLIQATVHRSPSVGNLECAEICYVVLPLYNSSNPGNPSVIIEAAIHELIEKVAPTHPDILITPLTVPPHNYPVDLYAGPILKALATTNLGIYNDVQVTIFIEKEEHKDVFHDKMKELNCTIDHVHISKGRRTDSIAASTGERGRGGGGLKVSILQGDVTKAQSAVIVNSTSIDMRHNSNAISKAIHNAAGPDLRLACQSLVDQGVLLTDGIVVNTVASGKLRCDQVIHAHVPGKLAKLPATKEQMDKLKTVVLNSLKLAEDEGLSSLAMPAFCLGMGNFSVPESAKPTLEAIKEFAQSKPSHLKEVAIFLLDRKLYNQFIDWCEDCFKELHIPIIKTDSSKGSEGLSTTFSTSGGGDPVINRGRLGTITTTQPTKKSKLTFNLFGLNMDTLKHAETEIHKYLNELIVDDMVDLGEMTCLLSETDMQDINQLAQREGVEVTIDRRLNRILVNGEERAVEKVCNQIQMNITALTRLLQELHMFEWTAENVDGTVEKYELGPAQQLEVASKRGERTVKLTIDNISCTVDLFKMEERDDVSGVTKSVKRHRKAFVDYPPHWDLSGLGKEVVNFVDVPETSEEYAKATNRFLDSINCQCDIAKVQRVQNPSEYTRYQSLKNTWIMLHGVRCVAEKELFHGTQQDKILSICSTGFNRGYAADSNAARYGKGVYFALNASYSMQEKYSKADTDGYKYILVCSLLVCKTTVGNEKIKVPPPTPDNPQVLYDTLVERITNPTIFVAMKDSQAYPKYVIMFKKRP